jgi:hypothetical protein
MSKSVDSDLHTLQPIKVSRTRMTEVLHVLLRATLQPMIPRHYLLAVLIVLVASAEQGQCQNRSTSRSQCRLHTIAMDTVRIGGDPVYIEPLVVEADSRGRVLLLGRTNYRYRRSPSGTYEELVGSEPFGIMTRQNGEAQLVSPPIGRKQVEGIRAADLGNGRWGIVFGETTGRARGENTDTIVAVWYGEYDGIRWRLLERLPHPTTDLRPAQGSSLVLARGELVWVVPRRGSAPALMVFRRTKGRWTSEEAINELVSQAEPLLSSTGGLNLAVVEPDPSLERDANSLLLRTPPDWRIERVLQRGADSRVYRLHRRQTPGPDVLAWATPARDDSWAIHARIGYASDPNAFTVTVDSSVGAYSGNVAPIWMHRIGALWAVQQDAPDGTSTIRLTSVSENGLVSTIGSIPNPYFAHFRAIGNGPRLLISGPVAGGEAYVASLLVTIEARCNPRQIAP